MTLNLFSTRRATASVWENNIWRLCTFANTARLPLLFLRKFGFSGKLLRVAIGVAVVAGPIIFGLLHVPQIQAQSASAAPTPSTLPSFDVASIKPDHSDSRRQKFSFDINSLTGSGLTLQSLIEFAYNVKDFQIHGGPGWANSETFEVQAKIDAATVEALNKLPRAQRQEQRRSMVQSLLADRFKLKVSHSSKELPIYALVLTKDGPKFSESASSANVDVGFWSTDAGTKAKGESMSDFANWLSRETGRKVVDNTGLQGKYDFILHWTQDRQTPLPGTAADGGQGSVALASDSSGSSFFTAIQEQLGLKLESKKGPVEILVIDSVEKPSEN